MIRALIVAGAIAAAALARHLLRLQTGRTPTAPRPIRTGGGTFPRATRTTGPLGIATTTASPASRDALESVRPTSPFHTAAQTRTRAVCADALVGHRGLFRRNANGDG